MGAPPPFLVSPAQASHPSAFCLCDWTTLETLYKRNLKVSLWDLLISLNNVLISLVQSLSRVQLFETPWTAACQASLSITNSWNLLWPKYWTFSFSISPSNEYSVLISFRIDWLDLSAVQGTPKSLLQHRSSKKSILQHSAFFIVQLTHAYMTTGKTIVLTRQTFVGKVMSLLFNMLSRLVIAFLPRSKHLLIAWLQSPSAVILEPPKIVPHHFHYFPVYLPWSDGTILVFWMLSFKPTFSLFSFTCIKRLFSASSLSVISVVSSAYQRLLYFSW